MRRTERQTAAARESRTICIRLGIAISPHIVSLACGSSDLRRERVRDLLQAEPVRQLEPFSTTTRDPGSDDNAGASKEGRDLAIHQVPTLPGEQTSGRRSNGRKVPTWPRKRASAPTTGSETSMLHQTSNTTAPLSPTGGISTYGNEKLVMPDSPLPRLRGLPSSPHSDPLMKDGAIIRPPVSASAHQTDFHLSHRPPIPQVNSGDTSMMESWRQEQAMLRRTMGAITAAARGDRAWSRSAGEVPHPTDPPPRTSLQSLPQSPVPHGSPSRSPAQEVEDGGMDIFEVLMKGPVAGKR